MAITASNQLLVQMLEDVAAQNNGQPVTIITDERIVGVYFPFYVSKRTTPPRLSPEHREELRRRHANLDDEVSAEEMIEMVRKDLRRSDLEQ